MKNPKVLFIIHRRRHYEIQKNMIPFSCHHYLTTNSMVNILLVLSSQLPLAALLIENCKHLRKPRSGPETVFNVFHEVVISCWPESDLSGLVPETFPPFFSWYHSLQIANNLLRLRVMSCCRCWKHLAMYYMTFFLELSNILLLNISVFSLN